MEFDERLTKIRDTVDPTEIVDAPFGIGEAVGRPDPVPFRLRMPVKGRTPDEYPVAVFWLHPWDLGVSAALADAGVASDPTVEGSDAIYRQNREIVKLIVDAERGWETLYRVDGSEWKYVPPDGPDDPNDVRLELAKSGALMGPIKVRSISITLTMRASIEGNSGRSSGPSSDEKDERNERRSA